MTPLAESVLGPLTPDTGAWPVTSRDGAECGGIAYISVAAHAAPAYLRKV